MYNFGTRGVHSTKGENQMLNQILKAMGHFPTAEKEKSFVYRSPFNPQEKTPSFFVFKNHMGEYANFKDYSSGLGGDIHKFLMEYYSITFPESKAKITELTGIEPQPRPPVSSFNQTQKKPTPLYKILSVSNVRGRSVLVKYLHSRGISDETMQTGNLLAIAYEMKGKHYFAVGFANNSKGYEIRNKYFKGNLLNKDLTTVITGAKSVKVFEGFMDYLSYLELAPTATQCDYIVLNSVSLLDRGIELLKGGYELIELYLDHDEAGHRATAKIIEEVNPVKIIDKRPHYIGFKDLNEYLLSLLNRHPPPTPTT